MEKGRIEFEDPTFREYAEKKYLKNLETCKPFDLRTAFYSGVNAIREHPIDIILHCPACGTQHIDAPEPDICECGHTSDQHKDISSRPDHCHSGLRSLAPCECPGFKQAWDNPPHKSHLCHECGIAWRPADVPTNGVAKIRTRGKQDSWPDIGDRSCSGCYHELRWHFEYTPLPSGRTGCGHPNCSCSVFITPEVTQ